MENAKNISIFLPHGNPKGIKRASITRDKIDIIQSSRKDFLNNKDLFDFIGVYIIVDTLETEMPEVYIGKGRVSERINQHNDKKDFWNTVFAIKLKTDEGFNDSQTSFIEHYFIKKAKSLGRSKAEENKQVPSKPQLEDSILCDINHYIDVSETLLSVLGLKIFQDLSKSSQREEANAAEMFYIIKNKVKKATGKYTEEGFILYDGSQAKKDLSPSSSSSFRKSREKLISDGILKESGEGYVVTKNYKCNSPSLAAGLVLGRSSNGWTEWKNSEGKTLDEVYRTQTEAK